MVRGATTDTTITTITTQNASTAQDVRTQDALMTLDLSRPEKAKQVQLKLRKRASQLSEWSSSESEDIDIYDPMLWECFGDVNIQPSERRPQAGRPFSIIRAFPMLDRWITYQSKRWARLGIFLQAFYDWWHGSRQGIGQKYFLDLENESSKPEVDNFSVAEDEQREVEPREAVEEYPCKWQVYDSHDNDSSIESEDSDLMTLEDELWPVYKNVKDNKDIGYDTDGDLSDMELHNHKKPETQKRQIGGAPIDIQYISEDLWDRMLDNEAEFSPLAYEASAKRIEKGEKDEKARVTELQNCGRILKGTRNSTRRIKKVFK
ncbi:unnamed protein product [Bursaphelenchus okinawaensis]|uniref:Uncharacterized protein n=1 Tax=Bursaphelenchus okinawaensis TaxID=465554 RepID=A0A811K977_9BILA|nr:unnamed protein product [Bursaphelenchus okinawaensis]CAG9096828.1 unnamed protein product [Bursaphelenchus okinawaensis]